MNAAGGPPARPPGSTRHRVGGWIVDAAAAWVAGLGIGTTQDVDKWPADARQAMRAAIGEC